MSLFEKKEKQIQKALCNQIRFKEGEIGVLELVKHINDQGVHRR